MMEKMPVKYPNEDDMQAIEMILMLKVEVKTKDTIWGIIKIEVLVKTRELEIIQEESIDKELSLSEFQYLRSGRREKTILNTNTVPRQTPPIIIQPINIAPFMMWHCLSLGSGMENFMQIVYFGSDPRKHEWRPKVNKMGKEGKSVQRCIMELDITLGNCVWFPWHLMKSYLKWVSELSDLMRKCIWVWELSTQGQKEKRKHLIDSWLLLTEGCPTGH